MMRKQRRAGLQLTGLFKIFLDTGRLLKEMQFFVLSYHGLNFPKVKDNTGESILAQIMTTKEMANYLKLHAITICKLSKEGKIPSIRIGGVWRFDKEIIDEWIARG